MKYFNIKSISFLLLPLLLLAGCNSATDAVTEGKISHETEHADHAAEGTVSLSPAQVEAIGLKTIALEMRNMDIGVPVTGKLVLPPQHQADISPIMGGIVKDIRVIEGNKVKKGQVLATLAHPDYIQMQQDYMTSLNTLALMEKNFARQKKLYEEKVGSGKDFQKISTELSNQKSQVKALKMKLTMLGLNVSQIAEGKMYSVVNVVSPLNGTVSLVETNIGAYVAPLTKLFEVVNNAELHADFRVYERDINHISVGQKIFFTTTSLPGDEFAGEIHTISPVFEENPKALHVHADIFNGKHKLIPGMYIQGRIIADNALTIAVPDQAIVNDEDRSFIFVKTAAPAHAHAASNETHSDAEKKLTFRLLEVIPGFSSGGYIAIKPVAPLPKDAQIAASGAYYLLAEMTKGESEHSH